MARHVSSAPLLDLVGYRKIEIVVHIYVYVPGTYIATGHTRWSAATAAAEKMMIEIDWLFSDDVLPLM